MLQRLQLTKTSTTNLDQDQEIVIASRRSIVLPSLAKESLHVSKIFHSLVLSRVSQPLSSVLFVNCLVLFHNVHHFLLRISSWMSTKYVIGLGENL